MSNIKVQGDVSGTGTFTIAAPNGNTDRTLTLPDETGTVLTSASPVVYPKGVPAFSAYQSSQQTGITSATWTKITFTTSQFDTTDGMYASSRFTPTIAGYYQINASVQLVGANSAYYVDTAIYKNGSAYAQLTLSNGNSNFYPQSSGSSVVYMNGSTDYVEIYAFGSASGNWSVQNTAAGTYFQGVLVRAD